ncbi:hypothetical protein [Priestia aryabhattai]|uniref:hypothetical protein n=1 Tax=Priestia aryabhattai TaxID=412384 RepID=UPI003CF90687
MRTNIMRFDNDKVIRIASGNADAGRRYIEQQNKQFIQNARVIKDTLTKLKSSGRSW